MIVESWTLQPGLDLALVRSHLGRPGRGDVRVVMRYCALCGTDLAMIEGVIEPEPLPMSLGHEFVGVVDAVGDGVEGLAVGDVVVSDLNLRCGLCDMCLSGRSHLCAVGQQGLFSNRAFSNAAMIDSRYLLGLGRCEPRPEHTMIEPLSCGLHAISWADPRVSENVLVIGAGGIGMVVSLGLATTRPRIPFDVTDVNERRLSRLVTACDEARPSPGLGQRYDVVFEASGSPSGLRRAVENVRPGGRICLLSHLDPRADYGFLIERLTHMDVTLRFSLLNGERVNLVTAAEIIASRWTTRWDGLLEVVLPHDLQSVVRARSTSPASRSVLDVSELGRPAAQLEPRTVLSRSR